MDPGLGSDIAVVSGIPRSGTSLLMQMLAAGRVPLLCDDVRPPDESNPRGYFEYAPVRATRRDTSWVAHAGGRAVKVIDALVHSLPTGPRYRVIFLLRELSEVLDSQRRMLAGAGRAAGRAEGEDEARLGRALLRQRDVALARLRERGDVRILLVEHRELICDPRAQAEAIDRFLGGGWDVTAMAACVDPALYRSRS